MLRGIHIERGEGPIVATALHAGHAVRADVAQYLALDAATRFREEDPFTEAWTLVAPTRVVCTTSRFELDLNRPRDEAIYRTPDDAWGLTVWREPLPVEQVAKTLAVYDAVYAKLEALLADLIARHGKVVVLDLHAYCHRRDGPDAAPADPAANPEINVGTGTVDRSRWGRLVERFVADLCAQPLDGRRLDARENVKYRGGHFVRWVHHTFPEGACALGLEMKKVFMDEWTGALDEQIHAQILAALRAAVPGLEEELAKVS